MRAGEMQRGAASPRARVHLRRCERVEQHRQHGVHAGEGGGVQRQLAEGVGLVLVRTGSQQRRHHLHVALARLQVPGPPTPICVCLSSQAQRASSRAAMCDEAECFGGSRVGFGGECGAPLALAVTIGAFAGVGVGAETYRE